MGSTRFYLSFGGGLGDVVYDFLNDPNSWYLADLVESWGAEIRIHTLCHNDGVTDLFKHHPHVHSHINEPWHMPCQEDIVRFNSPIDGFLPLHRSEYRLSVTGPNLERHKPKIYLNARETEDLARLTEQRPLLVVQPFAGLSDRDAFDANTLRAFVYEVAHLDPNARIVVVGWNHEREHKYTREEVPFEHPALINLIDRAGIRFCYHLVSQCDAFCGSHSNLIRTAWDFRKRNVCIMPDPLMTEHVGNLDAKYRYGFAFPESRILSYKFQEGGPREFHTLNVGGAARHLLGR